jgi:ribosomal-protein-serine acetyltransferase
LIEHPIQVGGLVLRSVAVADAGAMFTLVDANRSHLRRWLPWVDGTRSVEDTRRFKEVAVRQQAARESLQVVLELDSHLIGVVGFHRFDWVHRSTSMGYWLAEEHQGRGFMTSACQALIETAFLKWDLNRVEIRCATGNVRSQAIPTRLGFMFEGTLRSAEWLYDHFEDLNVYSLLASEFPQTSQRDS